METSTAKRRKIDHANGRSSLEAASASASTMGASGASAFVLETEELLKEVKLDYSVSSANVENTLRQFKDVIETLEPHEPLPITDVSAKFERTNRVTIPYPDPKPAKSSPYKLAFEKPSQVNVVGSWVLKTNVKSQPDLAVDMIVVMPTSIFQEKDYLNMRYFYKRAYYLAYVTAGLRKTLGDSMEFVFDHLHGNLLLPILVARPKNNSDKKDSSNNANSKIKSHPAIRIIPCAPEDYFPTPKLTVISNAIRQGKSEETDDDTKVPTPFYNTTLKAESQFSSYLRLLYRAANSCPAFKDACVLGRIWLQQRGFSGNVSGGGFGHFEWAVLIALLLQGGGRKGEAVLSPSLHSTQLFKATLQYIVSANLQKKLVVIGADSPSSETLRQSMPVLYDTARGINVLYKMTAWSITLLTEQAKWSLSAINNSPLDQFEALFIVKADQPLQMFDLLLGVNIPTSQEGVESIDRRGLIWDFSAKLYNTLKKALGERAQLVHINVPETTTWPISAASPKEKRKSLLVGITIDPLKASQGREYGPPYEDKKEAARFREFWGEKTDLWQFPDGNIVESLDWTEYSYLGFPGICEAIIRYILKFRLNVEDSDLEFYGRDLSKVMSFAPSDKLAFDSAKQAFEMFERDVRNLEDLPLHVRHISAISPELRRTSLSTPEFNFRKPLLQPMEVVVSFEVSGKWPENLAAIQRAKIAFLLKIGSSLEEVKEEVKTHLGLESATRDDENLAFLDVVYENGASFRLRVHSDLEESLLERKTKDQTVERHIRTEAADLLASYRRMYTNLPLHNQTVSTFCTRFPALSSSIRLTKHWFNSHKLSCHFDEELIELFVLQAFLKPYPWDTPCSAMTGFLRTLLLLSRWDWRDEPLVIDSADSLSTSQRLGIGTRLEAWRKIDPNMNRTVLFVATSHDVSGVAYTQHGPSKVVATRMTSLARSACKAVKEKSLDLNPRSLFQTPLHDYDVLLHLSPKVLKSITRDNATRHSLFKNLDDKQVGKEALPLVEPPAQTLLKRLNAMYSSPLLFFHGAPDDDVIAALWNPLLHRRKFNVHMPCSLQSAGSLRSTVGNGNADGGMDGDGDGEGEGELFEVNKNAILAEIARIGGDVIERIEVKGGS
ncbi:Nrap protein [Hypomontagnella submonticulosa]|nr:Nrap protein [Hypomontagnella submonticulosa]